MDKDIPLKISHDVSQTLQRKLEGELGVPGNSTRFPAHADAAVPGLGSVERAFVHVDYDDDHDPHEEHKPLYEKNRPRRTLKEVLLGAKKKGETEEQRLQREVSRDQ